MAPRSPSLRATSPELWGKLCSCFCLDRTRVGLVCCCCWMWDFGGSSGSGAVPSAFPLAHGGCLIYCSLLGNGQGGELASLDAALLSFPKKCLPPFTPSLAP